jgi:hypothetical protein
MATSSPSAAIPSARGTPSPVQRRGGLPVLGQPRPVLRQDRRALPRLHLHLARRHDALQAPGRQRRAKQRQGRQAVLPAARAKEIAWDDEEADQVVIPFEYRSLTGQEEITYGKKNQQDAIIADALTEIPKRLKKADKPLVALTAERRKNSDGQPVTFLEHHLRQYTRRNTSDFFIHKNLKGFLSRELDFYLKNEVLNLDEMETAGEDRAEGWFQIRVGAKITWQL